jgi:UDP-N-acetyl-D-mannosaminuronic acid dehydrogenase
MSLPELSIRLETKKAKLGVIGLGYVGLPVSCEFARVGFDVIGIDIQEEIIEKINAGINPIEGDEPGLSQLLDEIIKTGRFKASANYDELTDRDVILVCVETPIDEVHVPRYEALTAVLTSLGKVITPGTLVIIESTIAPGTTRDVVIPLLEKSSEMKVSTDFFVGHCPERVMPGKLLSNLRNMSRVVGGVSPETTAVMVTLYNHIVEGDLDYADALTAELVKTTENTYRDVQIAFANEVALICEAVGGDVWKVRELVNKVPGRNMHFPGAGVGGHCIPKDPWLLAYPAICRGIKTRLISSAREINDSMPLHVAAMIENAINNVGRSLLGSRILVLGYAYLENSDDTRNTPSEVLLQRLQELGAKTVVHDPYIPKFQGQVLDMAVGCDAAVLMVKHKDYLDINLKDLARMLKEKILIDGRNIIDDIRSKEYTLLVKKIGVG